VVSTKVVTRTLDVFLSASAALLLVLYDVLFTIQAYQGHSAKDELAFVAVFLNISLLFVITLPFTWKLFEKATSSGMERFLELPSRDAELSFSVISSFISDQALGSFLATLLIVSGKSVLHDWGAIIAGAYVAFLFIAAICIMAVSYIKFIMHFTKRGLFVYFLISAAAFGVLMLFFHVGLQLAK